MGSVEQDLAGELVSSVSTSFSVTGSKDVRGGTCRAEMSGGSADAVDARILATFSLKNLPKSSAKTEFPNVHVLLRIACTTIPVTSYECKRTVSSLRRLQTFTVHTSVNGSGSPQQFGIDSRSL